MRVNITLACTECGDRNYISKKINVTIQTVLSLKILLKRKRSTTHREQSKQQDFSCCFFYAFFKSFFSLFPLVNIFTRMHQ